MRHCPDSLRALPPIDEAALGELVHARADVFECADAVVAPADAKVGRARGVLDAGRVSVACTSAARGIREVAGGELTYQFDRPRRVDPDGVRVLHNDVRAGGIFRPVVVLAVEHE